MHGPVHRYLADDHGRLEGLLERAGAGLDDIDTAAYGEFRGALLRHIAMEEKILLPAAQRARGGEPLPVAAKLRLDHGALAALLVMSPTPAILAAVRMILSEHNALEENPGGVYDTCEQLAESEVDAMLARLRAAPTVPLAPYNDSPRAFAAAERAVARAGYHFAH